MMNTLYPIALGLGVTTKSVQYLIGKTFPSSFVSESYKNDSLALKMRKACENSLPWITRSTIYDIVWRSLPAGFALTYVLWKKTMGNVVIDSSNKKVLIFFIGFIGVTTIATTASKVRELLYAMTEKVCKKIPFTEGYIRPLTNPFIGPSQVVYEEGDLKGKEALLWYPAGQKPTEANETYHLLSVAAFLGFIALLPLNQKLNRAVDKISWEIQSWEQNPKMWRTAVALASFRIFCCYQHICREVKQCQEDLAKKDLSVKGQIWRGMKLFLNGFFIIAHLNAIKDDTIKIGQKMTSNSSAQK